MAPGRRVSKRHTIMIYSETNEMELGEHTRGQTLYQLRAPRLQRRPVPSHCPSSRGAQVCDSRRARAQTCAQCTQTKTRRRRPDGMHPNRTQTSTHIHNNKQLSPQRLEKNTLKKKKNGPIFRRLRAATEHAAHESASAPPARLQRPWRRSPSPPTRPRPMSVRRQTPRQPV